MKPQYRGPVWVAFVVGLSCGIGCLGCSGNQVSPSSAVTTVDAAPGTTTIVIANHVKSPYALDRVAISVDGDVVPLTFLPPDTNESLVVTTLPLAPGDHAIQMIVMAAAPGWNGEDDERVSLRTSQTFHVDKRPAVLLADVQTRRVTRGFAREIEVAFSLRGGELAPTVGTTATSSPLDSCATTPSIPHAICQTQATLNRAVQTRDVALAMCVREKLVEMRTTQELLTTVTTHDPDAFSSSQTAVTGTTVAVALAPTERGTSVGDIMALGELRIATLLAEVESCAGRAASALAPVD